MKFSIAIASAVLLAQTGIAVADKDEYEKNDQATYRIEITNKTPSQWFSPCLCALHSKKRMFRSGRPATTGQATFAEDGFNAVWAKELRQQRGVYAVLQCGGGLTPPDGTRVETISGPANARLTCASMPVTTNDVLTAITNVKVPAYVGDSRLYKSKEWDLGSEENSYSASTMPEDVLDLIPEGPDNPVTISDNVIFGVYGRPLGVPALLSPFTRSFFGPSGVTAEGTMSVLREFAGSDEFPAELYGWQGAASSVRVTRIK
ncbi:spondin domain-containing protein [Pseudomonadota bacterium]